MDIKKIIKQRQSEGYYISTDPDKLQMSTIFNYLKHSYWAKDIPFEVVERAVKNSFGFGLYLNVSQVGFARLITDFAVFAHLADVFILEEYRGKGLSKWLLHEITMHPKLKGLRKWTLATQDAHGLYRMFGFTDVKTPENNMELYNPDIYRR